MSLELKRTIGRIKKLEETTLRLHNHPQWEYELGLFDAGSTKNNHVIIDKEVFDYLMNDADIRPLKTNPFNVNELLPLKRY